MIGYGIGRLKTLLRRYVDVVMGKEHYDLLRHDIFNTQVAQRSLFMHYQHLHRTGAPLPALADTGFRVYSQTDEDGLLLFVFALIGMTNRVCIDMAAGRPYGSNSANLLCNWGWTGLLLEGDAELLRQTRQFYTTHRDTRISPPQMVAAWVTAENINGLLEQHGVTGEIDLLSLDLDGVDYWIWRSLEAAQPRVVLVEFQDIWGPERAVTVPYRPDFQRPDNDYNYCGASLAAFVKLGRAKGYRLVGSNRYGYNALFVRNGLGDDVLPEVAPASCLRHPKAQAGQRERLPLVQGREWVEV